MSGKRKAPAKPEVVKVKKPRKPRVNKDPVAEAYRKPFVEPVKGDNDPVTEKPERIPEPTPKLPDPVNDGIPVRRRLMPT